jgi:uncharacterized RDD family membrane protein YckC
MSPPASTGAAVGTTPYAKADLGKRFGALLIDGLLAGVVAWILGMGGIRLYGLGLLLAAAYYLVRDGLEYDFMDRRSIGKKLLKLRPVRLDGGAMDLETSVRRNWPLALGTGVYGLSFLVGGWGGFFLLNALAGLAGLLTLVEAVLVLTDKDGRRLGDKQANTQVINSEA